ERDEVVGLNLAIGNRVDDHRETPWAGDERARRRRLAGNVTAAHGRHVLADTTGAMRAAHCDFLQVAPIAVLFLEPGNAARRRIDAVRARTSSICSTSRP
ncbi:MAG TPA: hypothetical protein VJ724_02495, partial [Tahibacter sp.]|nr:hypothetical protein [Tahibacter sp.]